MKRSRSAAQVKCGRNAFPLVKIRCNTPWCFPWCFPGFPLGETRCNRKLFSTRFPRCLPWFPPGGSRFSPRRNQGEHQGETSRPEKTRWGHGYFNSRHQAKPWCFTRGKPACRRLALFSPGEDQFSRVNGIQEFWIFGRPGFWVGRQHLDFTR